MKVKDCANMLKSKQITKHNILFTKQFDDLNLKEFHIYIVLLCKITSKEKQMKYYTLFFYNRHAKNFGNCSRLHTSNTKVYYMATWARSQNGKLNASEKNIERKKKFSDGK